MEPIMKQEIESRKQRWVDFLKLEAGPGYVYIVDYTGREPVENDELSTVSNAYELYYSGTFQDRVNWALKGWRDTLRHVEDISDDLVPYAPISTGTEIFAEAFGCKVHRSLTNMPFALPMIKDAAEIKDLHVPNVFDTPLAALFEIADKVKEKVGDDVIFKLPDMQSPMDIAALIWDKNEFMVAMITDPEAVTELATKTYQLLVDFLDEWFRRYGTEYVAHYPAYFMSGGMTLSEDEVGIVNADMFNQFFRPHLVALSERYGGIGIHCCADSEHQWENFKTIPGLRLLNLCRNSESARDAIEFFSGHTVSMHYGWQPEGPVETYPSQYPENSKHVIHTVVETKSEAVRRARELRELRNVAAT